jgi:histidinol phosphatase-like enzyme (inositol monophosphatase family)
MTLPAAADPRVPFMLELSDRAATVAMRHFQSLSLEVATKADQSPVTAADREIEALLRGEILRDFPGDAVLGEEHGEITGTSGWRWIIDPIDGTISFAAGVPLFGTLIGLEHESSRGARIVAGVCSMPALGERVWAAEGGGAWWDRRDAAGHATRTQAHVRTGNRLAQALVCTTGLEYFERANRTDALVAVARAAGRVRGWSDCYGGMLVATGRADAWFDPVMNPWDSGPFPVILAEAGGVFTDFLGRSDVRGGSAVAASPALHAELLALLRGHASASQDASNAGA